MDDKFVDWDFSALSVQPEEWIEIVGDNREANGFLGQFSMTGNIAASNSIMYLIYGEDMTNEEELVMPYEAFHGTIIDPVSHRPDHISAFMNTQSLISSPVLSATTLVDKAYYGLFKGCTNLRLSPVLPSIELTDACYCYMFSDCTSLSVAPELPATELSQGCYDTMFEGCTSLISTPNLTSTTLNHASYYGMFRGCSLVDSLVCLATDISASECINKIFTDVSSTGTLYVANQDMVTAFEAKRSNMGMPEGWTIEVYQGS